MKLQNLFNEEAQERGYVCNLICATRGSDNDNSLLLTFYVEGLPISRLREINKHCALANNVMSTRARSVAAWANLVETSPASPLRFGKEIKGMASKEIHPQSDLLLKLYADARYASVSTARYMETLGAHKQDVNPLLDPWAKIYMIVTMDISGLNNFVIQRHSDKVAAAEMAVLAEAFMKGRNLAIDNAKIAKWHIPYILPEEEKLELHEKILVSVGRNASISYRIPGSGVIDYTQDIDRALTKILWQTPVHYSPFEQIAYRTMYPNARFGKLKGWLPVRRLLESNELGDFIIDSSGAKFDLYPDNGFVPEGIDTIQLETALESKEIVKMLAINGGKDAWDVV